MSASKNLGKVFMTPKGQWDKTLSYTKLDIVTNKVGKISCGYIATTDIEKNVEITDNRWLKLFELLDGDITDEYKAVQTDVTNKATDVDANKKAVDLIYSQMQKLYDVEISTTTPTNERTGLWINPDDISGVISIPEIKDDEVSDVDTWSSKKIDNVTASLKEDLDDVTNWNKIYNSSKCTLYDLCNLTVGGLNGVATGTQKYRVATKGLITIPYPILLTPSNGFQFGYVKPNDDGTFYWSGWFDSSIVIEKCKCKFQIKRNTENTSEIADLSEFGNSLQFQYVGKKITTSSDIAWEIGGLYSGGNTDATTRIRTIEYYKVKQGDRVIMVHAGSPSRIIGIHVYDINKKFISDSGWKEYACDYEVQQDGYIRLVCAYTTTKEITDDNIGFLEKMIYIINSYDLYDEVYDLESNYKKVNSTLTQNTNDLQTIRQKSYNIIGDKINLNKQTYNVTTIPARSKMASDITISSVTALQGMAIHNGVIFQLFSNDVVELIDYNTNTIIADLAIKSDHGDCIDFSNEYYADGDEFPLAYITADTTPAKVYVNRITRTGTTLIKTYTFPSDKTGYYAGHCLDALNNIIYQVGYLCNTHIDSTNNKMVVSKWDLSDETQNDDGTFTPKFISSFTVPFILTAQDQMFFDNKIFIISSHWENADTKIIVIDIGAERITSVIDDMPNDLNQSECEGISLVPLGTRYGIVLKPQYYSYHLFDFNY